MKKLSSLLVCAVFAIILAPDVKSAPIIDIDINECTVCCQQEDCLWLCETGLSSSIVLFTDFLQYSITQCNGDTLCQNNAIIQYNEDVAGAYSDNIGCVADCVSIHP